MATALKIEPEEQTSIVAAVTQNPGIVLLDREKFDAWYEKLRAKAPTDADVSTKKGRDQLRSFAAEVRSEKAAIDKARLRLTKEWRDMVSQANAAGKEIEERLETLAVEVRKPLTEWEEAEKARVESCRATIQGFKDAAVVTLDDTAASVRARGSTVFKTAIDPAQFADLAEEARAAKDQAVSTLQAALARLTKEEEERAELERLRAAEAERAAKEQAEREAREREEAERRAAEEAERRRKEAEEAETRRIKEAEERAAEAAREAEARRLREEQEARERELQAQIDEERRQREEAERRAQEERDRIAREEAARQAEADRIAAEQARQAEEDRKREANRAHRTRVMGAAKIAIMACGVEEKAAVAVVKAIVAGDVPNVSLSF